MDIELSHSPTGEGETVGESDVEISLTADDTTPLPPSLSSSEIAIMYVRALVSEFPLEQFRSLRTDRRLLRKQSARRSLVQHVELRRQFSFFPVGKGWAKSIDMTVNAFIRAANWACEAWSVSATGSGKNLPFFCTLFACCIISMFAYMARDTEWEEEIATTSNAGGYWSWILPESIGGNVRRYTSDATLARYGALKLNDTNGWHMVSHVLINGDTNSLTTNLLLLLCAGFIVERKYGFLRTTILCGVTAFTSAIAHRVTYAPSDVREGGGYSDLRHLLYGSEPILFAFVGLFMIDCLLCIRTTAHPAVKVAIVTILTGFVLNERLEGETARSSVSGPWVAWVTGGLTGLFPASIVVPRKNLIVNSGWKKWGARACVIAYSITFAVLYIVM